ncbi:hypothetical protein [Arthrobacter globiformis]|uniref:hypothetical protein n=1 Tax=Arthrobacter globiformis TaxID=1665 RepID=UPI00278F1768|nr:hypothetical protein [Arthrobacter globiformis]MDQ0618177.1 hypothetical protein [Arthrobacter globiformis]
MTEKGAGKRSCPLLELQLRVLESYEGHDKDGKSHGRRLDPIRQAPGLETARFPNADAGKSGRPRSKKDSQRVCGAVHAVSRFRYVIVDGTHADKQRGHQYVADVSVDGHLITAFRAGTDVSHETVLHTRGHRHSKHGKRPSDGRKEVESRDCLNHRYEHDERIGDIEDFPPAFGRDGARCADRGQTDGPQVQGFNHG